MERLVRYNNEAAAAILRNDHPEGLRSLTQGLVFLRQQETALRNRAVQPSDLVDRPTRSQDGPCIPRVAVSFASRLRSDGGTVDVVVGTETETGADGLERTVEQSVQQSTCTPLRDAAATAPSPDVGAFAYPLRLVVPAARGCERRRSESTALHVLSRIASHQVVSLSMVYNIALVHHKQATIARDRNDAQRARNLANKALALYRQSRVVAFSILRSNARSSVAASLTRNARQTDRRGKDIVSASSPSVSAVQSATERDVDRLLLHVSVCAIACSVNISHLQDALFHDTDSATDCRQRALAALLGIGEEVNVVTTSIDADADADTHLPASSSSSSTLAPDAMADVRYALHILLSIVVSDIFNRSRQAAAA